MPRARPRKRRSGGARRAQAQDGGRIEPSGPPAASRAPTTGSPSTASKAPKAGGSSEASRASRAGGPSKASRASRAGGPSKASRASKAGNPSRTPKSAASPRARASRSSPRAPTYGERPPAPWHPLPLSELLILVGAIGFALGLGRKEISNGGPLLLAGVAALALGTFEVTLREHRSGYRSHTVMLALLPVLVFHSLVILLVSEFATAPRLLNVGLFAIDIALFAFLFRLLRARFLDARHERVLREG
jgi:hypothetical protein